MMQRVGLKRIQELDFFRGLALLFMVYFHTVYDMNEIFAYDVSFSTGFNYYIGKVSGILFILIAAISCFFARNNTRRALRILGLAAVITVATHLFDQMQGVKFGILHFMGVCMLIFPLLDRLNAYLLAAAGTIIIFSGNAIQNIAVEHDYFFMLGIYSDTFRSSDYYPLIPWLGVFIYGIAFGKLFYSKGRRLIKWDIPGNIISKAGRHTLIVYLLHQPVIIAILYLLSFK